MKLKFGIFWIFLLIAGLSVAQNHRKAMVGWQRSDVFPLIDAISDSLPRHTSFQPYVGEIITPEKTEVSWFRRKLFREHLLQVDTGSVFLAFDPAFNFELGRDLADKNYNEDQPQYYKNTRGFQVRGNITDQVGFQSAFYENQSVFPDYLDEYITASEVVPGQGRIKQLETGFDYAMASGSFFYTPGKNLVLMAGHGKQFIGNGYRSLFLSDNAFNYPYARADLFFFNNKLAYSFMYSSFQSLYRLPVTVDTEPPFLRRSGNFHYISWVAAKNLHIGFFEGSIYPSTDSSGKSEFHINSLNPVIGSQIISTDPEHKTIAGLELKVRIFPSLTGYTQVAWDPDQSSRAAFQAGLLWKKSSNSRFRIELNEVPGKMYAAAGDVPGYLHYRQSLTHPAFNDFREILLMADFTKKRFFTHLKLNYIDYIKEVTIILPAGINTAWYGQSDVMVQEAALGWVINPASGMNARIGIINRNNYINLLNNTSYFYIGFRTNLPAAYYDF